MYSDDFVIINWIDKKTQEKIVQKFLKKELTPEQFKESLENSMVIIKQLLNINIINDLEL